MGGNRGGGNSHDWKLLIRQLWYFALTHSYHYPLTLSLGLHDTRVYSYTQQSVYQYLLLKFPEIASNRIAHLPIK